MELRRELQAIKARYLKQYQKQLEPFRDHNEILIKDLKFLEKPEGQKALGTLTQAGQKLWHERWQREKAY